MQIVESLENTIGNEYKIPIRKFERNKSRELAEYLNKIRTSDDTHKCINLLHVRIQTLFKFFRKENLGMLPFRLDKDFNHKQSEEQLMQIPESFPNQLQKMHQ